MAAEEFLSAAPDAFGDIEIVDGLVVRNMAQSEVHDLVVRRLAAALENARQPEGPCFRVSSDVAVRFSDASNSRADHRLNVRYPDIFVRGCEPYDVNTVRDQIRLIVEVTSEATFQADTKPSAPCMPPRESPDTWSFISTRTGSGSAKSRNTVSTGQGDGTWHGQCTAVRSSWMNRCGLP